MAGYTSNIEVTLPEVYALIDSKTDVALVTEAIDRAATIIETVSGVIFEADYRELFLKKSDALWVRRATIFQAAWLIEQQDALTRIGARAITQDGMRLDTNSDLDFVLAPMAKRALNNCSWTKNGTVAVAGKGRRDGDSILVSDNHPWAPMGSA